ncbi:hypothetical protein CCACVL1_28099 [Corchorus capsularis]|uniref:Uncharacterized protein n=1 Tax=Corchorus capsularis TaxID=210143 RepID=A0A1R3G7K5_COCAP|nr:hypothetical protein CCACVL1_28099 [Corchorus capsularis]
MASKQGTVASLILILCLVLSSDHMEVNCESSGSSDCVFIEALQGRLNAFDDDEG